MEEKLVSVVIPFYKGSNWLCEAVDSVLSQTYINTEIIIINDGSPEDLSEFIERYGENVSIETQENQGAAAARNKGIEMSNGEYIAFLDADDVWMPNKLEVQITSMIKKNAVWSHSSYTTFGNNMNEKRVDISNYKGNVFPLSIISNPIATPGVIIKKSVFKDNPNLRFKIGMKYGEDTLLWLRLSLDHTLMAIQESLVRVRIRGSNSSLRAYSQIKARAEIWYTIKAENIFDYKKELSLMTRLAFNFCSISHKILKKFKGENHNCVIEPISKIIYLIPWILFKVEKKLLLNKKVDENI